MLKLNDEKGYTKEGKKCTHHFNASKNGKEVTSFSIPEVALDCIQNEKQGAKREI